MEIIQHIIDAIFPPRESERIVRGVSPEYVLSLYKESQVSGCLCLSDYRHPVMRALITENKFWQNKQAAKLLAVLLMRFSNTNTSPLIFVPIPLGKKRAKERGYNQVLEVLLQTHATVRPDLLTRPKETVPQMDLNRTKRLTNVVGVFKADQVAVSTLQDITLVIVDDVCTTGATLQAARAELAPHLHPSCRLLCLALAH